MYSSGYERGSGSNKRWWNALDNPFNLDGDRDRAM